MDWDNLPSFTPAPWIRGGHAQTIVSHLLKAPAMPAKFERWVVNVEGGDELWCRFYPGGGGVHGTRGAAGTAGPKITSGSAGELAVLFHGLGGSADSKYMQACGQALLDDGHSVLLVNHRGSGEGADHAQGIYHSGAVADVASVLRFARAQRPNLRLTAIGFSLSANLLLNAGALIKRDLPDRIVAVNPPIDLHVTSRLLVAPQNFVYDQKFVRDLRLLMAEKFRQGKISEMPPLPRFCRLTDFDEIVTAPRAGFRSRDEYYTQCSSFHYASRIQPPSLILTAADDPFIPADPFLKAQYPSHVKLQIEKRGGHVGYLSKNGRWLAEFVKAAMA